MATAARTTLQAQVPPDGQQQDTVTERIVLRLIPRKPRKKITWSDDTVDNEDAGKKKSKKCCIFHRQRAFGEWSDEEDSDAEDCGAGCSKGTTQRAPQNTQTTLQEDGT